MPKDFAGVMHEWKTGQLHSGSKKGKTVTSQKQAEAIAFSEQRQKGTPGSGSARYHLAAPRKASLPRKKR